MQVVKRKIWAVNQLSSAKAEVLLYGFIGEYEAIDDAAFLAELRSLESLYPEIDIRINCGGGDVYQGLAIFNGIKNSRAKIESYIDGVAASMGAIIALASSKVYMSKYAKYMTHRVTGAKYGNADALRMYATHLEQLEQTLAQVIAERVGITEDEAKAKYITDADRWIDATQAIEEKLVDGIYDADPVSVPDNAAMPAVFEAFARVYNIVSNQNFNMKKIAQALGLAENATEEEILSAVQKQKQTADDATARLVAHNKARAKALVDEAIGATILVEDERAEFESLAEANYEVAAKAIAKMKPAQRPANIIANAGGGATHVPGANGGDPETWEALVKKGDAAVAAFKAEKPAVYAALYKAEYGTDLPKE